MFCNLIVCILSIFFLLAFWTLPARTGSYEEELSGVGIVNVLALGLTVSRGRMFLSAESNLCFLFPSAVGDAEKGRPIQRGTGTIHLPLSGVSHAVTLDFPALAGQDVGDVGPGRCCRLPSAQLPSQGRNGLLSPTHPAAASGGRLGPLVSLSEHQPLARQLLCVLGGCSGSPGPGPLVPAHPLHSPEPRGQVQCSFS